eukprot:Rhum_TRINITY_DN14746_c7_g2::Rhum_TRINITY_DN14746_c7_g2_i1::g.115207::m.115207
MLDAPRPQPLRRAHRIRHRRGPPRRRRRRVVRVRNRRRVVDKRRRRSSVRRRRLRRVGGHRRRGRRSRVRHRRLRRLDDRRGRRRAGGGGVGGGRLVGGRGVGGGAGGSLGLGCERVELDALRPAYGAEPVFAELVRERLVDGAEGLRARHLQVHLVDVRGRAAAQKQHVVHRRRCRDRRLQRHLPRVARRVHARVHRHRHRERRLLQHRRVVRRHLQQHGLPARRARLRRVDELQRVVRLHHRVPDAALPRAVHRARRQRLGRAAPAHLRLVHAGHVCGAGGAGLRGSQVQGAALEHNAPATALHAVDLYRHARLGRPLRTPPAPRRVFLECDGHEPDRGPRGLVHRVVRHSLRRVDVDAQERVRGRPRAGVDQRRRRLARPVQLRHEHARLPRVARPQHRLAVRVHRQPADGWRPPDAGGVAAGLLQHRAGGRRAAGERGVHLDLVDAVGGPEDDEPLVLVRARGRRQQGCGCETHEPHGGAGRRGARRCHVS